MKIENLTEEELKDINQELDTIITEVISSVPELDEIEKKIEIDSAAVDPDDTDMLEDLVLVAVQQALEKAKELADSETSRVTGGMNLPGMM